jgi:hypothetical protein
MSTQSEFRIGLVTKPPISDDHVVVTQGDQTLFQGQTDEGGSVEGVFNASPDETVHLQVGDVISCNVLPRDLDGMRCMTKERPKLGLDELGRRWRRAMAGLPPETEPEKIAEIALVAGRDEELDALPEIPDEPEG